jgi:protein-arginine kinase activator protein McsA
MIHYFTCENCNKTITDTSTKGTHYCPVCHKPMRWNMDGFMSGKRGDFYHESKSMGCSAKQVDEMRKLYPGSEYKKRGKNYVLVTRSVKEMDRRLKERGMVRLDKE